MAVFKLVQVKEIAYLIRSRPSDALIWIGVFGGTLGFGLQIGLGIGLLTNLLLYRSATQNHSR
jgi:MFS superfamily sulfate permease-like transporter